MSAVIAILADLLVAVLLVVTIATSLRLSRRMARMKADEGAMRAMIAELVAATDKADGAIAALRATVQDSERTLADRLGAAARHTARLSEQVAAGEAVIDRVTQIAAVSRRLSAEAPAPAPRSAPDRPPAPDDDLKATVRLARDVAERSARRMGRAA